MKKNGIAILILFVGLITLGSFLIQGISFFTGDNRSQAASSKPRPQPKQPQGGRRDGGYDNGSQGR